MFASIFCDIVSPVILLYCFKHFKHRYFVTLFNTSSIDIVTYCIRWFSEMYMYIIHSGPSHFFSFKYKCRALLNCQSWNLKVYLHTNTESIYWPICLYICEMWWFRLWTDEQNSILYVDVCTSCFFFHTCTSMLNIQRAMLWCGFCCDKVYHLQLFVRL